MGGANAAWLNGAMPTRFQLVARAGHPDFLSLPWGRPLAEWDHPAIVDIARGVARHVVRFVDDGGQVYALKETNQQRAEHEYAMLRALEEAALPSVRAVGVVTDRTSDGGAPLDAVLVTEHLQYSLPYRYLFTGRGVPEARTRLIDAMAALLVRLHLEGFFWGDCSLSNTLFLRDAGALSAHLVDAETSEHHPRVSPGQRAHDLDIAVENVAGELYDLAARDRLPSDADPAEISADLAAHYETLWDEINRREIIGPDERYRIEERMRRLNDLGFDVDELEFEATDDGERLRVGVRVVEEGHHRRQLARLVGLEVKENQARALLNDIAAYAAWIERETGETLPEAVAAYRWLTEVYEPMTAAVPDPLRSRREPAEVFYEILDHRHALSETCGRDVGNDEALASYLEAVLPQAAEERRVLPAETGELPAVGRD